MPFALGDAPKDDCLVVGASLEGVVLGCGGSILRRGDGSDPGVMMLATDAAAEFDSSFLGRMGGGVERLEGERVAAIAACLGSGSVGVALVPFIGSVREEELAAVGDFAAALKRVSEWSGEVWMYETFTPLWPNRGVDVSAVIEGKRELLQDRVADGELGAVLGLNRYRGLRPVVENVEAFLVLEARVFLREWRRWSR